MQGCAPEPQDENRDAPEDEAVETPEAELATCPSFSASNAAHVAAGRAFTRTQTFLFFQFVTYYAQGTSENLGTSGTAQTTLYQLAAGRYARSATGCSASDAGTSNDAGISNDAGPARDAAVPDAAIPDAGTRDAATPATYSLRVDAPSDGATLSGSVTVRGQAPGFVNVEVWDGAHQNPPLGQATPSASGAFSLTVDTTKLTAGASSWTVHAWDVAPGGTPAHDATVTLNVLIGNVTTPPVGRVFVLGAENKDGTHPQFEAAVQCDVNINQITTGWCSDWSNWESSGCGVFPEITAFHAADAKHAVELSLAPWPQALGGQSWGACANGDYDAHYTKLAQNLLANRMTHVLIRLGYEWDGNWFPWGTGLHETGSVTNRGQGGTALEFGRCFKRVDGLVQAVARASATPAYLRMVMNPIHDTVGTKQAQLQQVVDAAGGSRARGGAIDVLGVDFYDYPARNNFDSRMQASVAFAKSIGAPLSFPEWGVGGDSRAQPAVDDAGALYIANMQRYFSQPDNGIVYASYFNCAAPECAGNHSLIAPNNPNSSAAFTRLFGNGKLGCGANARTMLERM